MISSEPTMVSIVSLFASKVVSTGNSLLYKQYLSFFGKSDLSEFGQI